MSAACMPATWYIAGMKKKPLTVTEFARMGGNARAQKLSPERRKQIASEAGKKGGRPRKAGLRENAAHDSGGALRVAMQRDVALCAAKKIIDRPT